MSDLDDPVLQRADGVDGDARDIVRLQGEIGGRHDAGPGQQDDAIGEAIAAAQVIRQFGNRRA